MTNNRKTGAEHEMKAAAYLEQKGYRVIGRNVRNRFGEIDIICLSPDDCLVFAEVKYRKNTDKGSPLEAVGAGKIRNISKVAAYYISGHRQYSDHRMRFDVIGICGDDEITHIENAFYYVG